MKLYPMRLRHSNRAGGRSGALLLELSAATALFAAILAIAVPVVATVAAIRDDAHRRQLVQIELANIMEQVAAHHRAGHSLKPLISSIRLSEEVVATVPEASLTIETAATDDLPDSMRVTARISWSGPAEQPAAPAELTAFFVDRPAEGGAL